MRMAARSKRSEKNEEESVTLPALAVKGDCVLDFCLKRNFYVDTADKVFSVLINGEPG